MRVRPPIGPGRVPRSAAPIGRVGTKVRLPKPPVGRARRPAPDPAVRAEVLDAEVPTGVRRRKGPFGRGARVGVAVLVAPVPVAPHPIAAPPPDGAGAQERQAPPGLAIADDQVGTK